MQDFSHQPYVGKIPILKTSNGKCGYLSRSTPKICATMHLHMSYFLAFVAILRYHVGTNQISWRLSQRRFPQSYHNPKGSRIVVRSQSFYHRVFALSFQFSKHYFSGDIFVSRIPGPRRFPSPEFYVDVRESNPQFLVFKRWGFVNYDEVYPKSI